MENKKVKVKSETNGTVSINLPELQLKRTWERKGTVRTISFNDLEQAIYNRGVEYMFLNGILSIDDMEVKKALGLEPDDVTEPTNIIILSDDQKKRYLTVLPMSEFKVEFNKLPYEQMQELADYAIENEIVKMDKCDFIKERIGIDIIKAIQLNKTEKEN